MPGMPPSIDTEREGLLAFLRQQRDGLSYAAYGLTEEQIRLRPTAGALSLAGLLKHAANTERGWTTTLLGRSRGDGDGEQAYVDSFTVSDDDNLESLLAELDAAGTETEAAVASLADLGVKVQLPPAPWFPADPEGFSARWILLHLIEELARHAGHADIVRESIDGATMYELLAAAEGWPETDWLKPWRPEAAQD